METAASGMGQKFLGLTPQGSAYLSGGLFAALFLAFGASPSSLIVPVLGVAAHVTLFPVVAALPAPSWARQAGYGWLIIDIVSNVMSINGADPALATAVRYGGHISAAIWIGFASWQAKGSPRLVGIPLAFVLGGYSLVAPWVSGAVIIVAFLLIIAWLPFAGRSIAKSTPGGR